MHGPRSRSWGVRSTHYSLCIVAIGLALIVSGCTRYLMPAPSIYEKRYYEAFKDVPPELRNNKCEVIYGTDRETKVAKDGSVTYGRGRSRELHCGVCTVEIGRGLSWDMLASESIWHKYQVPLSLRPTNITPLAEFPEVSAANAPGTPGAKADAFVGEDEHARQALVAEIERRLAITGRKEAWIFIHGYNNGFDDAVFNIAGLWHFLGREGVPIAYTWPSRNSLWNYGYDRESAEFTITHLKRFIKAVASCPHLTKIHIIAHSTGVLVATTAIRELALESRGGGRDLREEYKFGNIVLAAGDVDLEVASQRVVAEGLLTASDRITVYVSEYDNAVNFATWIYTSARRLGRCQWLDVFGKKPPSKELLEAFDKVTFVNVRMRVGVTGHSYYLQSSAVSSDIALLLRYNRAAGAQNGRPLQGITSCGIPLNYWYLTAKYPDLTPPAKPQ